MLPGGRGGCTKSSKDNPYVFLYPPPSSTPGASPPSSSPSPACPFSYYDRQKSDPTRPHQLGVPPQYQRW